MNKPTNVSQAVQEESCSQGINTAFHDLPLLGESGAQKEGVDPPKPTGALLLYETRLTMQVVLVGLSGTQTDWVVLYSSACPS